MLNFKSHNFSIYLSLLLLISMSYCGHFWRQHLAITSHCHCQRRYSHGADYVILFCVMLANFTRLFFFSNILRLGFHFNLCLCSKTIGRTWHCLLMMDANISSFIFLFTSCLPSPLFCFLISYIVPFIFFFLIHTFYLGEGHFDVA